VLRLAVGHDARQPFFYVCPKCKAATRGALVWDGGAGTSLEVSSGRLLDSEKGCTQTVSINPEIPASSTATGLADPGGSAFLTFFRWLGAEKIQLFQAAAGQLRHLVSADWEALGRLTTFYINRDWPHFDAALTSVLPDEAARDLSPDWKRDHYIHFLYDLFLRPIWALDPDKNYLEMKVAWNALWSPDRPHFAALAAFAKTEAETGAFRNTQNDLLECIGRYVTLSGALMPGLMCNMVPDIHQSEVDGLRLFRDEYELLRDLYIQSFEASHKALRWVVAAANADTHGDHARFIPVPGMSIEVSRKPPADLDAFSKLTSAYKRQWLALVPEWNQRWDLLFDRHLRNDIGHASVRHDLATGLIHRDQNPALAYTRFVQKSQRIIHPLVACANAMKIVRIYSAM
jgi:hypothetical protein